MFVFSFLGVVVSELQEIRYFILLIE